MVTFELRFGEEEIEHWADRYSYQDDTVLLDEIGPRARARGYMTREGFLALGDWKTGRQASARAANPARRIEEATRFAFATDDARLKIGTLLVLEGVSWATASVILHFCDSERWPVLDFRALWSLGYETPPHYSYTFWERYTEYVRTVADETGLSMRTIDRALWQYSKENQAG